MEIQEEWEGQHRRNCLLYTSRSILESVMMDLMYEVPSDSNIGICTITKAVVDKTGEPELTYRDTAVPRKTCLLYTSADCCHCLWSTAGKRLIKFKNLPELKMPQGGRISCFAAFLELRAGGDVYKRQG